MSLARFARRVLLATGVVFVSGCGILDPCTVGYDVGMNGTWELVEVNGDPIPSVGYPLPFPSTDRLKVGRLRFRMLENTGGCGPDDDDLKTSGIAAATYSLVTASGQTKPTKVYAGRYLYDHQSGDVTLKAFNKSVTGPRLGDEFTVSPAVPLFGTYVLTFRRISLD